MRQVFLNGEYIAESEAKISIFDRSVQFADSIYEVLAVIDGRIVDFTGHMSRLHRSLEKLSILGAPNNQDWLAIFRQLIDANHLQEGTLYLQVSRGVAMRDFLYPSADTPLTVIAYTQDKQLVQNPQFENGMSVMFAPDLRWGRCDIKTTQLLYASMMKTQAQADGFDDAWLVDDDIVTEGTSNNVAIITHDDELITHKLSNAILPGTTRNIILDLAADMPLTVIERAFTTQEARAAKEAFASAASLLVMPVTQMDGGLIGSGKVGRHVKQLRNKYIDWARETSL